MNSQQPRPDDPWLEDEDDEPQLRPWWKNRRIWWLVIVVIALLIFIFSQGHAPSTPEATKNPQPIAVVQPYVPVAAPAKAAPGAAPLAAYGGAGSVATTNQPNPPQTNQSGRRALGDARDAFLCRSTTASSAFAKAR